jgi:uncharacterized protein (DUF58 family)
MDLRSLPQLFSIRDIRNAAFGTVVVFGGIGLAAMTYIAHRTGSAWLAGTAAAASMVFVVLILIFVVPPLAKNASREASQLNLPFELTLGGAIILGLIAIVGFSAWNTGNNLLFLILSFLLSAVIVGFVAGGICLKKLDVKMRFPETIFAGEETDIIVSIHNRKRIFSSYSVVADVRGKEHEESAAAGELRRILPAFIADRIARAPVVTRTLTYFPLIPRGETTESKTQHTFQRRGRFLIKDFELSTKFPFAFFRHRRRLPARETELTVLPKLEPLSSEIDDIPLDAGQLVSAKRGSGQDLLTLRDYRPNDDLRRVDWKATARSRGLIVREFAAEDDRKITVLLDPRLPDGPGARPTLRQILETEQKGEPPKPIGRFEKAVTRTASLLSHFIEQQAEVRLVVGAEAGDFGVGSRHLVECLRRLAILEPQFEISVAPETIERSLQMLADTDDLSHYFVVTTLTDTEISSEIAETAQILSH